MARLTDAVGNGNERCLLTPGCRHECGLPAELQVKAGVGTAYEQDKTKVAGADVQCRDEHAASSCTEDDGDDDVVAGFLEATGCVSQTASNCVCNGVRRSLDEVRSELVEVECGHNLVCLLANMSARREKWILPMAGNP